MDLFDVWITFEAQKLKYFSLKILRPLQNTLKYL